MDALSLLMGGFADALTPVNLLWCLAGVVLGTAVGVLPGLGSSMAVALLLPLTFLLEPTAAFIMFAGIYYGGQFGGATTSILLNTPGQSSSIVTAFEGHAMALRGRAAQALAASVIGSFVGGIIATTVVAFFAQRMVAFALGFGPAEYFALAMLAFVSTAAVVTSSPARGIAALGMGIALSVVGIDDQSGAVRMTLGIPQLLDGVDIVVVTVGLLAVGEVLHSAFRPGGDAPARALDSGTPWLSRADWRRSWGPWLRGTALGLPFGVVPAGGAEIPTFLSYGAEKALARRRGRSEFGRGAIEGVAGPEAANNATTATAMIPLLGLGLPTSATAAVMLAAFQQYGMQPGPLLFESEGDLVWALLASMFVGTVLLLVINLPFAPLWARLLRLPRRHLYAGLVVFATVGVYAGKGSVFEVGLLYAVGALGLLMRRYGIPVAPVLIGVILGPLAEGELRRAMAASQGDLAILVDSGIAVGIYAVILAVAVGLVAKRVRDRRRARPTGRAAEEAAPSGRG
ncbi:tripartite tricarboxylate transporter permease [Streptomonospora sp. S1-112]|uniref:Tripartite tricarboxylate transporter permease n=1 Tax=Streptomonospora mangrovi TaxID=2883123 RepID=A0A9X3NLS9_9ACTN|nr:tripartite tricarboxylate transporter permease [Streptomonospora mangrovi]MDA0564453.1 tripartite tricarboxylate transporter permease [Streptomonospora mangrovi]